MKKLIVLVILMTSILCCLKTGGQTVSQQSQAKRDTLKAQLKRGQDLARQGNNTEAAKIFSDLMRRYPDNTEPVQFWLMVSMKRSPDGEQAAISTLTQMEKEYPDNKGIIFFKAFLEAEYGQNEEALTDFNRLIKLQPDTAVNYIGKGQVLYAMERYQESFDSFEKATTLNPSRADVWNMKAGSLAKLNRLDDAITSVTKSIGLRPGDPTGIYNRACFYCLKGDKTNALADLEKAIAMNPQFREHAVKDEDFKALWEDPLFIKLTKTDAGPENKE